jgi:hypothetical protein
MGHTSNLASCRLLLGRATPPRFEPVTIASRRQPVVAPAHRAYWSRYAGRAPRCDRWQAPAAHSSSSGPCFRTTGDARRFEGSEPSCALDGVHQFLSCHRPRDGLGQLGSILITGVSRRHASCRAGSRLSTGSSNPRRRPRTGRVATFDHSATLARHRRRIAPAKPAGPRYEDCTIWRSKHLQICEPFRLTQVPRGLSDEALPE